MGGITHHTTYRQAISAIKHRIQSSQIFAVPAMMNEIIPQPVGQMSFGHARTLLA